MYVSQIRQTRTPAGDFCDHYHRYTPLLLRWFGFRPHPQILKNLVTNAWESMADRSQPGCVRVNIKTMPPDAIPGLHRYPVDFQARADAYACLEIADQGEGIPEKDIEKIFDPFYSSRFIGRGLGLALVLGLVKAHDGCITVECRNTGSIFRVYLPAR
ncbi:MAG: ATP-binding protein [Desulfobacteraceae bacterium]